MTRMQASQSETESDWTEHKRGRDIVRKPVKLLSQEMTSATDGNLTQAEFAIFSHVLLHFLIGCSTGSLAEQGLD